ncbi:hypothetical protein BS47DRAFT_1369172 [Hydnum rufescens UP504]|uniref:Uncharacterized protein n=1 Tax=Hydnum rufescens UP504 TaxID=1448309 RepID=A0A9P6DHH9_9AGAM|nr:hypothetical protein BS47DRAFT_1369172 [Hydnum rufescens UP504]
MAISVDEDFLFALFDFSKLVLETPLALVLSSLTIALGNSNEAQLQLDAVGIKDAWMSAPSLLDRVIVGCRQEVLSNCPVSNLGRRDNGNNEWGLRVAKALLMSVVLAKKGLASATLDSEHEWQRRLVQHQNGSKYAIRSPSENGAIGFFKRVGKGLVGSVGSIDPAVGDFGTVAPKSIVFDVASSISEGIGNTTTVFDKP